MANRIESNGVSINSDDRMSMKKCHNEDDDPPESIYNSKSKSAYAAINKKKLHPLLLGPSRREQSKYVPLHTASKNNLSEFTQRVMSAKLLRVKQVQNQLSETQIQLNELINENRILRNLQKRQEGALRKYEGNHAELPQLIRSHNEEIRTLKASNKLIKAQLKESSTKLKERENELESLRESYNKLKKLSSEKNLLEREKLQKKVEELQQTVREQDEKIQVLSRKVLLESKNYRHHLNVEINKHKETQKDLNNALSMITKLENQLLMKDRVNWIPGAFGKLPHKRDLKNVMSNSKTLGLQSTLANSENTLTEQLSKSKTGLSESTETDLELLNGLQSSNDTPSPSHDILPEIHSSKKLSPDITGGGTFKNNERGEYKNSPLGLKNKTLTPSRKISRSTGDLESDARGVAQRISRNIETMENMVEINELNMSDSNARLNSLYEELKTNVSKIEEGLKATSIQIKADEKEECDKDYNGSLRKNVSKRKLEERRKSQEHNITEELEDLSPAHQQKLISMAKTWSEVKDKVQEERMKVELKMKELGVSERSEPDEVNKSEEKLNASYAPALNLPTTPKQITSNFRSLNFVNDDAFRNELIKTDKILKGLMNDKTNENNKKMSTNIKGNISYRTESRASNKFVDEFQSEYQKQNLLKALKAIDVGREDNSSSEELETTPRTRSRNDYSSSATTQFLSAKKSNNDFIGDLFRVRSKGQDRTDGISLDLLRAKDN